MKKAFNMRGRLLAGLVTILLSIQMAYSNNSVMIESKYKQIVTSSTLKWVSSASISDEKLLENAVVGSEPSGAEANSASPEDEQSSVYVCRARQNGVWISGQRTQKDKECVVSLLGNVGRYSQYEILQNIENSAMLKWVPWRKYQDPPLGTVAVTQDNHRVYIARAPVVKTGDDAKNNVKYSHFIGKMDASDSFGKLTVVNDRGVEEILEKGEVLVETEPIAYDMNGVEYNEKKEKATRDPRVLAETILSNSDETQGINVDSVLSYNSSLSQYWGQGHYMLKALNTTVRSPEGTIIDNLLWGIIRPAVEKEEVYKVEMFLEPGTACNVTLRANYTTRELPYTATVISYYPDSKKTSRKIQGSKKEVGLMDITAEYGPVYFLQNNTLVPTTTTTTTTTTSTTTTTAAPMPDLPPDEPMVLKKHDDGQASSAKKGDNLNMMSDDGDAMSLKKNEDNIQQAGVVGGWATSVAPSVLLLLVSMSIARLL